MPLLPDSRERSPKSRSPRDGAIVASWNRHVRPEDAVWHLGDLSLLAPRRLTQIVSRLNDTIRLILGHHDRAHPMTGEKSISALC